MKRFNRYLAKTNNSIIKYKIEVPADLYMIKEAFNANGYKLYLVGGCVRDSLLNNPIKDYDLATDAIPDVTESILKNSGFKTIATGKSFGVINVLTINGEYEITTFRADVTKGRHPSVKFTTITTDSKRRDLTINALYYDIEAEHIIDLVGGVNDLKNKIIKTVGNPLSRFDEDPLRILRCVRFTARFNSVLSRPVHKALKSYKGLTGVSSERIKEELIKGIKSAKDVTYYLELLKKYNLFNTIFPGLKINEKFYNENDHIIVIAYLLKDNKNINIKKWLINHSFSRTESKAIHFLISLQNLNLDSVIVLKENENNAGVSPEQIFKFCIMINHSLKMINAFIGFKLSVNGDDVKSKFNIEEGRELGLKIFEMEKQLFIDFYKQQ